MGVPTGTLWGAAGLIAAVLAVLPTTLSKAERAPQSFLLAVAGLMLGSLGWSYFDLRTGWQTDLATALRMTLVVTVTLFVLVMLWLPRAWRLWLLLCPCILFLGMVAMVLPDTDHTMTAPAAFWSVWMSVHIAVSLITYAAVTLAAVGAVAYLIQQRALKGRSRLTLLSRALPPLITCETVEVRLLLFSVVVLGAGIATGTAMVWLETGSFLRIDHKTIFTTASFGILLTLLITHTASGVRGRTMVRMVLAAYLLLTLAFPGVKFVRQMLLGE